MNATHAAFDARDLYFYNRGLAMGRGSKRLQRQSRRLSRRLLQTGLTWRQRTRLDAINSVLRDRGIS